MRILALVAFLVPVALSAQIQRDSVIAVNMTRTVKLAPDQATWFVTVEGTAETSAAAQALGESKVTAVIRALRALGPSIEIGAAIPFSVGPTPGMRGYPGSPSQPTTTARTAMRVRVTRMADMARALAAASEAGAAGTSGVTFESTVADSTRRAEVANALTMLRQEAEIIATALNGRIGGLVDVSTTSSDRFLGQPTMLPMEGMSQPTYVPEVSVSVTVTARFRLVR